MPEKPEVMTVTSKLERKLLNRKIISAKVYYDSIIEYPSVSEFEKNIKNQTMKNFTTRGKWIVIELDDYYLLFHLRMEGKFFFRKKDDPKEKHEHVEFILDNNISFRFHDVRKFGKMYLIENSKVNSVKPLSDIGLEFNDKNLTKDYLYNHIHKKRLPIKTVLLDQSIIAGIGNIYDDEILFMSRINPNRKCSDISINDCSNIIKNTNIVMEKAIKLGGTTIKSFTSSEGVHGLFQNELLVHGKAGEKCPVCKTIIEKTKIGGRGTHYCPKCQKK